jgi:hypothetical protein
LVSTRVFSPDPQNGEMSVRPCVVEDMPLIVRPEEQNGSQVTRKY